MKTHKTLLKFGAVVLMFVGGLTSCADKPSATTAPVWTHEVSDLPVYPGVVYGQLSNGMRYVLMHNETPSDQASLHFQFGVGSLYEEDDQRGLAHFIEHMAFNGTTNVPEGEMLKILERKGLAFGADTNASTSYEYTTYDLSLPNVDEDTIDTALMLMRETASEIVFDGEAIERERGVVKSEKRSRKSPAADAAEAGGKFMMPHALTNERSPIGTDDVLTNAKRERFVDLYDKYYRPERAILVMVGDFDVASVEAKIKSEFSGWQPRGEAGLAPQRGHITKRGLVAGVFQHDDIGTRINIAMVHPPTSIPDTIAERQRGILHGIASGIVNQRLGVRSRESGAPFYGAGVGYSAGDPTGTSLADSASASVSSPPEKWREALGVLEQEIRKALEHGFTQAEIDEQLANIRTGAENAILREDTRSSASYSGAILGSYDSKAVFTHPKTGLANFLAYEDKITPDTVWDAFKEQWKGDNPRLFMSSSETVTSDELIEAYTSSRTVTVSPPEQFNDGAFAYTNLGPKGKIVWRDEIEDFGITRVRFANNVMVNVKHTQWEKNRVRINVRLGAGQLSLPEGMNGLTSVVGSSYMSGGLEAHDIDALQRILAGKTVGLGFGIGSENFGFSGATIPDDMLLQLQLWIAYLQHPAWREEPFEKMRIGLARQYELRGSSTSNVSAWELPTLLHSGDPRWDTPSEETMRALTIKQARNWIDRPLAHEAIEISIVGDIDVDEALDTIAQTFGTLPARDARFRPYTEARLAPNFPKANASPHTLTHRGEKNRALGRTYWPTTDSMNIKTARIANVMRAILDLKLIEEVREKQGGSYSPSAFSTMSDLYKGYGYMGVNLDVEPDKLPTYFAIVDSIVANLAAGNITEDELTRGKAPLLESITQSPETNGYWMSATSRAQTHSEDLENLRTREQDYRNITVEDLTNFATKYLTPENAWRVQVVPE